MKEITATLFKKKEVSKEYYKGFKNGVNEFEKEVGIKIKFIYLNSRKHHSDFEQYEDAFETKRDVGFGKQINVSQFIHFFKNTFTFLPTAKFRVWITNRDLWPDSDKKDFVCGGVGGFSLHGLPVPLFLSSARVESNSSILTEKRAYRNTAHELGHVFGLGWEGEFGGECPNDYCVMGQNIDNTMLDIRITRTILKGQTFCADCKHKLREYVRQL